MPKYLLVQILWSEEGPLILTSALCGSVLRESDPLWLGSL